MNIEEKEKVENEIKEEPKKHEKAKHKNKWEEEITKLTEELGKEKDKAMRIQAEMMNFRKRKEDEISGIIKYANEDVLKELLSIVDNFERALALENDENREFLKGFQMIYSNILGVLNKFQVVEINCLNEAFDPTFHQAVLTEAKEGIESGVIIDVLQKGYMYKDKVLRAAMVKVSE